MGVAFSADIKCEITASNGNQILWLIGRTITYEEKQLTVSLYNIICRPHLKYCFQAHRPYRKKGIDKLESIKRRATKMFPEPSESRLIE